MAENGARRVRSFSSGGMAGVWAKASTRDGIFDALRSKETFAPSGPRLKVRLFGGVDMDGIALGSKARPEQGTRRASRWAATWTDPDFDASPPALYYAHVTRIPTPRWSTYDALKYKLKMGDEVPRTLQERAYTSPIWYNP